MFYNLIAQIIKTNELFLFLMYYFSLKENLQSYLENETDYLSGRDEII